jgi:hypothetical protein
MLFVLDLGSDDHGEFRDFALRGQKPYFSSGGHRLILFTLASSRQPELPDILESS